MPAVTARRLGATSVVRPPRRGATMATAGAADTDTSGGRRKPRHGRSRCEERMPRRRLGSRGFRRASGVRRELVAFVAVALVVFFAVAAITILITEKIARDSARREAENTTSRMAEYLVQPLLGNVIAGEPEDERDLDQIIDIRKSDGTITDVFVWTADGTIVYSSDKARVGTHVTPTPEMLAAINGKITSDIDRDSEVDAPALHKQPQLEVYAPISAAGERLAF